MEESISSAFYWNPPDECMIKSAENFCLCRIHFASLFHTFLQVFGNFHEDIKISYLCVDIYILCKKLTHTHSLGLYFMIFMILFITKLLYNKMKI